MEYDNLWLQFVDAFNDGLHRSHSPSRAAAGRWRTRGGCTPADALPQSCSPPASISSDAEAGRHWHSVQTPERQRGEMARRRALALSADHREVEGKLADRRASAYNKDYRSLRFEYSRSILNKCWMRSRVGTVGSNHLLTPLKVCPVTPAVHPWTYLRVLARRMEEEARRDGLAHAHVGAPRSHQLQLIAVHDGQQLLAHVLGALQRAVLVGRGERQYTVQDKKNSFCSAVMASSCLSTSWAHFSGGQGEVAQQLLDTPCPPPPPAQSFPCPTARCLSLPASF